MRLGGGRVASAVPLATEETTPQLEITFWNVKRSGTLEGRQSCHFGIYAIEARADWVG